MLSKNVEHVVEDITNLHHGFIVLIVGHFSLICLILGVLASRVPRWIAMPWFHHTTLWNHFIQLFELLINEFGIILLLLSRKLQLPHHILLLCIHVRITRRILPIQFWIGQHGHCLLLLLMELKDLILRTHVWIKALEWVIVTLLIKVVASIVILLIGRRSIPCGCLGLHCEGSRRAHDIRCIISDSWNIWRNL